MDSEQVVRRCAVHPDRSADFTCERCGNYSCVECMPDRSASQVCATCDQLVGTSRYHVVPVWRLVLMSVLSFGLYEVYWMYKNWQSIKRADRSSIWPAIRALFGGFTYFSMLTDLNLYSITRMRTNDTALASLSTPRLSGALGIGYLVSSMTWRLPDPYWLITTVNVAFLVPAARRIWELSSEHARNKAARWSWSHSVASLLGLAFWLLALLGLFLEE